MVVITCDNFDAKFDEIAGKIENAKFFSFDFEFSGIKTNKSLFDSCEERYLKYCQLVKDIIPLQLGISCFEFDWDDDSYKVTTYTFSLFKKPILSLNRCFMVEALAVVFLAENNFDFNKSFCNGISYLNRTEKDIVREKLKSRNFFHDVLNDINTHLIIEFEESKATVYDWYDKAQVGDELSVAVPQSNSKYYQEQVSYLFSQLILSDSQKYFKIYPEDNQKIRLKKVTKEQLKVYENGLRSGQQCDFVDKISGFQRIVELLIASKKPLVGHNCSLDFLILFNEFIGPLPATLAEYKSTLHALFPIIFDTKFLSYETKDYFEWENNSLGPLFNYFNNCPADFMSKFSKPVVIKNSELNIVEQFHDSGYDAYCTGCVFLQIAHFLINQKLSERTNRSITYLEHFRNVENFKNNVHLIACSIPYMKIDGPDPLSTRPKQLYVQVTNPKIDYSTLYKNLKKYGVIDIKPLTSTDCWSALVAVGSHLSAQNILNDFKRAKDLRIEEYSILKHSSIFRRSLMCCGVLLSGGLLALLAFKKKLIN